MRFIFLALTLLFLLGCVNQQTSQNIPIQQNKSVIINNTISINQPNSANYSANSSETSPNNLTMQNQSSQSTNNTNISSANQTIISVGESIPIPQNDSKPKPKTGLIFGDGQYSILLDDIAVNPDTNNACGIFSISYTENQSEITKLLICPGVSDYWRSPANHTYRIFVQKVVPGYSKESNWAEVSIFG